MSGHNQHLSRLLSNVLRHRAHEMGLEVRPGGFIYVDDLKNHQDFRSRGYTGQDIENCVAHDNKQRFVIRNNTNNGRREVKACQGHSIAIQHDMTKVTNPAQIPTVIHGTHHSHWASIKSQGLHIRGRQHIHFAPGETGVISGMPKSCNMVISIDAAKAMADGIEFFISENEVILSPGDRNGYIRPKYFKKVHQISPYMELQF